MINVVFWRHEGKCKCSPMALRCVCVGERERVCVRARNLKRRGKVCVGSWYRNTSLLRTIALGGVEVELENPGGTSLLLLVEIRYSYGLCA